MTKKRKINTTYIHIVDDLLLATDTSEVTVVVLAQLIGIEYITLDKYLRKERFVSDPTIAKRMVVVTNLLNELVDLNKLPIPPETSNRLKSGVILEIIDQHLNPPNQQEITDETHTT